MTTTERQASDTRLARAVERMNARNRPGTSNAERMAAQRELDEAASFNTFPRCGLGKAPAPGEGQRMRDQP